MEESRKLSMLLNLFADCLGLQINYAKSAFVGFGLSQEEETQCSKASGTLIETLTPYAIWDYH